MNETKTEHRLRQLTQQDREDLVRRYAQDLMAPHARAPADCTIEPDGELLNIVRPDCWDRVSRRFDYVRGVLLAAASSPQGFSVQAGDIALRCVHPTYDLHWLDQAGMHGGWTPLQLQKDVPCVAVRTVVQTTTYLSLTHVVIESLPTGLPAAGRLEIMGAGQAICVNARLDLLYAAQPHMTCVPEYRQWPYVGRFVQPVFLRPGDLLKITVFGDDDGELRMRLLGMVCEPRGYTFLNSMESWIPGGYGFCA